MKNHLIEPHGGKLINLIVNEKRKQKLKKEALNWLSIDLTQRQLCDLELLLNGGFSPLSGFMSQKDYQNVCKNMRLADGILWPMPITLDVSAQIAKQLKKGQKIALRDAEGTMLASLMVEDIWQPDKTKEAKYVFGSGDQAHPGVYYLMNQTEEYYIGGKLEGVELPPHYDFKDLRHGPAELREEFIKMGWQHTVAFQTRNPMHRAHVELTLRASKDTQANLLIQPVVGMTKPGDVDHYTRVRAYQSIIKRYPKYTAMLSLLPLAMRMGGPREALWHAIIRKNHGCNKFIVGRDHAGPGKNSQGEDFYGPYEAQELVVKHAAELGMEAVPFKMMVYLPDKDKYEPIDEIPEETEYLSLSGTELRARLSDGRELPEWFTFAEVAKELRRTHPPRHKRGFTIFLTGLSGAGKSTIANILMVKLLETGGRPVTLLDGDIVRKHLSSELGFSKEDRNTNIRRIGFVASEISKNGGIAICAPIAPYENLRQEVKEMISSNGGFILVYVSTPIEICEQRDRKGLYAKARAGKIKDFTGIDDPYEEPDDADITVSTVDQSAEESAQEILLHLEKEGYLAGEVS